MVPRPLCVSLTYTFTNPVPQDLAPAVSPTVLSGTVPHPTSRAPRALPLPGELILPTVLPDLYDAAAAAVSSPAATSAANAADAAALMPPMVRYFGCVAVVTRIKTIV